ncbi:MAG: 6,7-dimethyl-8-ribityllumazine synthase [Bacteroidales bacterium]|nr:6,7-dimethyl-8-ribityllumazine synthase [Candidatus Liminaster caballi]
MNPDPAAAECPANSTDASVGIVVSDMHSEITGAMLNEAIEALKHCGVEQEDIYVAHVPTAMELTFAARQMSIVQEPSAVIMLGCASKADDLLFDSISQSVTHGATELNLHSDIPYIFGVLLTPTLAEAKALSEGDGNKGAECAISALKMVNMMANLVSC